MAISKIIIHIFRLKEIMITIVIYQVTWVAIIIFTIKFLCLISILIAKFVRSQSFQFIQCYFFKVAAPIRISLNTHNTIGIDNKKLTPFLVVPSHIGVILIKAIRVITCDISLNYTRRIHHLYRTLTIFAAISPAHARMPAAIIITHCHKIHWVNGKYHLAVDFCVIK